MLLRKSCFIYEVGDLRLPSKSKVSLIQRSLRSAENTIIRKADFLVTTSPGFITSYFKRESSAAQRKIVLLENRLSRDLAERSVRPTSPVRVKPRSQICVGFVGYLRYASSLFPIIEEIARRPDQYEMRIYGDGPLAPEVTKYASTHSNIHYFGPFLNPEELPNVYKDIHLNYVVYDNRDANVRLAIPNKLYESLYFGIPLVAAEGTELARRVLKFRAGFVADPRHPGFATSLLDQVSPDGLTEASRYALSVPTGELLADSHELIKAIASCGGRE